MFFQINCISLNNFIVDLLPMLLIGFFQIIAIKVVEFARNFVSLIYLCIVNTFYNNVLMLNTIEHVFKQIDVYICLFLVYI